MMVLRVPHIQQSTKVVHCTSVLIWYGSFVLLYNDQLMSVIRPHGVVYDSDGWVCSGWDD